MHRSQAELLMEPTLANFPNDVWQWPCEWPDADSIDLCFYLDGAG